VTGPQHYQLSEQLLEHAASMLDPTSRRRIAPNSSSARARPPRSSPCSPVSPSDRVTAGLNGPTLEILIEMVTTARSEFRMVACGKRVSRSKRRNRHGEARH
jgi:hypothetical protein